MRKSKFKIYNVNSKGRRHSSTLTIEEKITVYTILSKLIFVTLFSILICERNK